MVVCFDVAVVWCFEVVCLVRVEKVVWWEVVVWCTWLDEVEVECAVRVVLVLEEVLGRPTGTPALVVDDCAEVAAEDVVLVGDAPFTAAAVEDVVELDDVDAEEEAVLPPTAAVLVLVLVLDEDEDEDPVVLSRDGMPAKVMPAAAARTSLRAAAAPVVVV